MPQTPSINGTQEDFVQFGEFGSDAVKVGIIAVACQSIVYGVYAMLFMLSTYILLHRGFQSRANVALLSATTVMFIVSTAYLILCVVITILELTQTGNQRYAHTLDQLTVAQVYVPAINSAISDAVVIWRAWVLWEDNRKVMIVPLVLLVGSIAAMCTSAGYAICTFVVHDLSSSNHCNLMAMPTEMIAWVLSLATNVATTCLIAYKAWEHRQFIKINFDHGTVKSKAQGILSLLVESGTIFCILWIIGISTNASFMVNSRLTKALSAGDAIADTSEIHLMGIYPTIIILLVTFQKTVWGETTGDSWTIQPAFYIPDQSSGSTSKSSLERQCPNSETNDVDNEILRSGSTAITPHASIQDSLMWKPRSSSIDLPPPSNSV